MTIGEVWENIRNDSMNLNSDAVNFAKTQQYNEQQKALAEKKLAERSWSPDPMYWGGAEGVAADYSGMALSHLGDSGNMQGWAQGEAQRERGPQAWENRDLSNNEAFTRGYHQNAAMDMAAQQAMGNRPSEAAYMLQGGLDRAVQSQQGMAAGARGAGAMALSQGNAQANTAGLQSQAFGDAGRLRAQEMSQGLNAYGGLASQQREQDMQRLGMGNQMAQFNANNNDQYRFNMASQGQGYGNQSLGWYQAGMQPINQQAALDASHGGMVTDTHNQQNAIAAGQEQASRDRADAWRDRILGLSGTALTITGGIIAGPAGAAGGKVAGDALRGAGS